MNKNGVSKIIGMNDRKNKPNSNKNITLKKELIKNYSFKNKKSKQSSTFKEKDFNYFNFNSETTTAFFNSNSKLNKNFSKTKINENELKRKSLLYDSTKKIEFQGNKLKKNLIDKKIVNNNNNKLMSLLFKNKNQSENNYINTNPSNTNNNNEYINKNNKNSNTEMKIKFFINKKLIDKSCPKFNMNNNNNIKYAHEAMNQNYNEIIEESCNSNTNNAGNKKQIDMVNSIRGSNNLMHILSPKNTKTKSQTNNLYNPNNNKGFALRKIKTINNNKNNDNIKKDFTLNNVLLEKRRPRRFESEIESKFIDSTNLFVTSKNKSSYINYEQKKLFNSSGLNFIKNNDNNQNVNKNVGSVKFNNNIIQKSNRDSKSVSVNKNNFKNNLNKINKIVNINEPYLTNLFKMFDDFEHSRKNSTSKKNNIDIKKKYSKNIKEKKKENEIDENKIMENISQNTLTMYTIYLLSKNYKNYENRKIGIKKIQIFDYNDEEIPIICYNTNADFDNGKLFNSAMTKINLIYNSSTISEEVSLITNINKNIHINFYLNNIKSNLVKYIKIFNFYSAEEKIYPVKNIELFKGNIELFKGILSTDITEIQISNNTNDSNKYERNFSSSKTKTQKNGNSNNNKKETNSLWDKYHTARNNMLFNYIENENDNNSEKENISNKENANNNKIINSINSNINRNTINIHINNNGDNISNLELLKNLKNTQNNNNEKQKLFNENNNFYYYSLGIPNVNNDNNINDNIDNNEIQDEKNNILRTSINKQRNMAIDKIPFNKEYTPTDFNNIEENYSNEVSFNANANTNISTNTNININVNYTYKNSNYIEFNKIKLVLISNYGHKKYVGLTGIEFYNLRGEQVHIETAQTIGALPKDLHTIYEDDSEERIFENVFNNFNNTNEKENMWVTKLKKNEPKTFLELYFKDKLKISKIKIYNYNEKNNLEICTKHIQIFLDDRYFDTIFLNQGTGEVAFDYISSDKNKLIDDDDNKPHDFGQDIIFPLKSLKSDEKNKTEIKYASFLYEQNYETPFMPCGTCIKFQFLSNFYKGESKSNYSDLKYNDIGIDSIEIYNDKNFNIADRKYTKYKLISNCEIFKDNKNKIILNGAPNEENYDNCLFYLYEEEVKISYIKFYPLSKNLLSVLNSVNEVKISCDNKIIFEGNLYYEQPTIVLFTCDMKITKNINEKYLTKKYVRQSVEERKEDYISLILN